MECVASFGKVNQEAQRNCQVRADKKSGPESKQKVSWIQEPAQKQKI
jgi:hypothetical protein